MNIHSDSSIACRAPHHSLLTHTLFTYIITTRPEPTLLFLSLCTLISHTQHFDNQSYSLFTCFREVACEASDDHTSSLSTPSPDPKHSPKAFNKRTCSPACRQNNRASASPWHHKPHPSVDIARLQRFPRHPSHSPCPLRKSQRSAESVMAMSASPKRLKKTSDAPWAAKASKPQREPLNSLKPPLRAPLLKFRQPRAPILTARSKRYCHRQSANLSLLA